VKLNEKTFKPTFMKLLEWSREEEEGNINVDKLITFYKVVSTISDVLKAIFQPYWDYFLEYSVNDLGITIVKDEKKRKRKETNNHEKYHHLIMVICDSLRKYIMYDEEGVFNSQSKFDMIQDSLMNQFENTALNESSLFLKRFKVSIIPCLSELSSKIPQVFQFIS
jgi:hypothetical protein